MEIFASDVSIIRQKPNVTNAANMFVRNVVYNANNMRIVYVQFVKTG